MYVATAIVITIADVAEQSESFSAHVLASCGPLSAAILLRSTSSFLLLPAALLVLALASRPSSPAGVRGAPRFLTWVTMPILCVPVALAILERLALLPRDSALATRSAPLVVPPAILWLTLFPFDGTTRLCSKNGP
jgi:hypothetical protein